MPSHHFVVGTWNWQAWLIFLLHYWSSSWRSNPVTVTIEPRLSGSSNSALGPRCERLLIHFVSNLCRGTKNNWWMTTYQSDLLWLPHDLNPSMPVSFMFGALVHGRARIHEKKESTRQFSHLITRCSQAYTCGQGHSQREVKADMHKQGRNGAIRQKPANLRTKCSPSYAWIQEGRFRGFSHSSQRHATIQIQKFTNTPKRCRGRQVGSSSVQMPPYLDQRRPNCPRTYAYTCMLFVISQLAKPSFKENLTCFTLFIHRRSTQTWSADGHMHS